MITTLATWRDAVALSPLSFLAGVLIGIWLGARFLIIRKHHDDESE